MKKSQLEIIEKKIKEKANLDEEKDLIDDHILGSAISKSIVVFIISVLSFLLRDKVSKLSIFSPTVSFAFCVGVLFILLTIIVLIRMEKKYKYFSCEKTFRLFKIYDLGSFIAMTCILLSFVTLFLVTPTTVSGVSMSPTLKNNDKVVVWHLGYSPKRNDIVIIDINDHYPHHEQSLYVKRVVAVSGDKIEYKNEYLVINGVAVQGGISQTEFLEIISKTIIKDDAVEIKDGIVPKGYSIVLGDNRGDSTDSRHLGLIHNVDILGKVTIRFFPINKIKFF